MVININEKTGFICEDSAIKIYHKNKIFYALNSHKPVIRFNLPKGVYTTFNKIKQSKIVEYPLPELPKFERKIKVENYPVIVATNPHKCTIDFSNKRITIDPELLTKPTPVLYKILFHEVGHFYYKTELFADRFAHRKMIELGFNPSQILQATTFALTYSFDRKEAAKNLAFKIQK